VVFAFGTDSGFALTPYGEWHARELELLMDYAGLSAQEAIAAGTTNAARTVGLEGEIGTLEPGMLGDLILVNGDPLQDIRVLQDRKNIEAVFVGGEQVTFDGSEELAWANDRSLVYSTSTLTYEGVQQGEAQGTIVEDWHLEHRLAEEIAFTDEAREFAHEVTKIGRADVQAED
jgi:adenine deaminase